MLPAPWPRKSVLCSFTFRTQRFRCKHRCLRLKAPIRGAYFVAGTCFDCPSLAVGTHSRKYVQDEHEARNTTPNSWTEVSFVPFIFHTKKRFQTFRVHAQDPGLLIFLAADHASTYSTIQTAFGKERVLWLEKNGCLDRRPRCQQMALADMYILSRSSQILGSTWSSFTEVPVHTLPTQSQHSRSSTWYVWRFEESLLCSFETLQPWYRSSRSAVNASCVMAGVVEYSRFLW